MTKQDLQKLRSVQSIELAICQTAALLKNQYIMLGIIRDGMTERPPSRVDKVHNRILELDKELNP